MLVSVLGMGLCDGIVERRWRDCMAGCRIEVAHWAFIDGVGFCQRRLNIVFCILTAALYYWPIRHKIALWNRQFGKVEIVHLVQRTRTVLLLLRFIQDVIHFFIFKGECSQSNCLQLNKNEDDFMICWILQNYLNDS